MEVLDPRVVEEAQNANLIATGLPVLLAATPPSIAATVNTAQNAHFQAYQKLAAAYRADAAAAQSIGDATKASALRAIGEDLRTVFNRSVAPLYTAIASDLQLYAADLKRLLANKYAVVPGDPEYAGVVAILRVWRERVVQLQALIGNDKQRGRELSQLPLGNPLRAEIQQLVVDAQVATAADTLAQLSIQSSPFAYAVASAPKERWAGRYNKVYSRGDLGAFDVAIKLDPGTGNYLIKGLAFDPSDVARVASKVTTQALLIAAQMAGAPVKLATSAGDTTPGAALSVSSGALADAQASLAVRRARQEARRAALLTLANTIVNEEKNLQSADDAMRKGAMTAIRVAFSKREAILRGTPDATAASGAGTSGTASAMTGPAAAPAIATSPTTPQPTPPTTP